MFRPVEPNRVTNPYQVRRWLFVVPLFRKGGGTFIGVAQQLNVQPRAARDVRCGLDFLVGRFGGGNVFARSRLTRG